MKPQRVRRRSAVAAFDPLAPPRGGWPLTASRFDDGSLGDRLTIVHCDDPGIAIRRDAWFRARLLELKRKP